MPNRIIRESALTSHSLAKLSDGAERLFWRLTIVADDHGRFDAYPPTVKARCFPTLVDRLKSDKIRSWLIELSRDHCLFYTVEGRPYGQFHNWAEYQRQYGHASKFPPVPADCGTSPQDPALTLTLTLNRESILRIDTHTAQPELSDEFVEVYRLYPRKVGKQAARKVWDKMNGSRPPLDVLLKAIAAQAETEQWKKDGGRFVPHLATWLKGKRWEDEVTGHTEDWQKEFLRT